MSKLGVDLRQYRSSGNAGLEYRATGSNDSAVERRRSQSPLSNQGFSNPLLFCIFFLPSSSQLSPKRKVMRTNLKGMERDPSRRLKKDCEERSDPAAKERNVER